MLLIPNLHVHVGSLNRKSSCIRRLCHSATARCKGFYRPNKCPEQTTHTTHRLNTAFRLPQWARRPKVVVLLYRGQSMCRSISSPLCVSVVMHALVSCRIILYLIHSSVTGVCYQAQRRPPSLRTH